MRMWMLDPKIMCQKHLCGEHVEIHMMLGTLKAGKKIDGYIKNNLCEPKSIFTRHEILSEEMKKRGYQHNSPICIDEVSELVSNLPVVQQICCVNQPQSKIDLLGRCEECKKRYEQIIKKKMENSNVIIR